jgi:hypothetical protein
MRMFLASQRLPSANQLPDNRAIELRAGSRRNPDELVSVPDGIFTGARLAARTTSRASGSIRLPAHDGAAMKWRIILARLMPSGRRPRIIPQGFGNGSNRPKADCPSKPNRASWLRQAKPIPRVRRRDENQIGNAMKDATPADAINRREFLAAASVGAIAATATRPLARAKLGPRRPLTRTSAT